ncbi:ATP-binding cassette domain-containing protein [Leptolyngbya sp. 7M]|uniref:ATP-binding cassette domain-containing protein n=1 Tax=Leptolyngbya sp. 7M TaxID=2812896 RepID=UPI0029393F99|nr:ATP-binding cassette domain-containing protein [Leptolyngbya sp. 7M]
MPPPILSIRNLNHFLGSQSLRCQVLHDIDLDLHGGEIVILTGPSGAGKSTLLSLIGGLRSVQSGSLKLFDRELCGVSTSQLVQIRRQIGFIFQSHNLLEFLTARENVRMSVELQSGISYRVVEQRTTAMLNFVKLGDRLDYYPHQLSGGQKQRVAIARALVNQPKLVLADEPTASLDSKTGRDIVEMMQRLAKEQGCTILIVTHDHRFWILPIGC